MAGTSAVKCELLESLIESLQCYSCGAVPGPSEEQRNRYNCIDYSHQLCEDCRERCMCGSPVVENPNPMTQKLLKNLPMYCKHYISGCREMFAQAEDLDYHQNGCIYRQLFCPYLDCYSLFCEFQIDEPLKKEHLEAFEASKELITVEYHENMKCLIDLSADDCIFNTNSVWLPRNLEIIHGVEFFFVGESKNNMLYFWIYFIGSPQEAKNYAYNMSFTSKEGETFNYYGKVKPLDKSDDAIITGQSVFMIGAEVVKKSRNEDMKISIHSVAELYLGEKKSAAYISISPFFKRH